MSAAVAGVASSALGLAMSELAAGASGEVPSLVVSVADLVIRYQPPGAKDLVVQLFGATDKLALSILVVIVALTAGAVAGLLARGRFIVGVAVLIALGAIAFAAGAREPLASPAAAALNTAISDFVSVSALWILLHRPPIGSRRRIDWSRREFLIATATTLGGAVVAGGLGRVLLEAGHPTGVPRWLGLSPGGHRPAALTPDQQLDIPGITPLVVPNETFYRVDTALLVPRVDVATWSLQVKGMVDRTLTLSYDDLLAMPSFEQYVTLACVSNEVGGDLVGNALWSGVRLKDILMQAGVDPRATQVVGRSIDEFWAGFPTSWALSAQREPMIALAMNGSPLPAEHGFPARLIVPGLFGYTSATKWLSEIEVTTREAVDSYWVPLGYAKDGPILTQSRIDLPKLGEVLEAGQVTVAGVAWAPDRGIQRVEVRVDGGGWQPATMARSISPATWVQWALTWQATPGRHTLEVRATDGAGDIQTDRRTPGGAPDGARGHHRVSILIG